MIAKFLFGVTIMLVLGLLFRGQFTVSPKFVMPKMFSKTSKYFEFSVKTLILSIHHACGLPLLNLRLVSTRLIVRP